MDWSIMGRLLELFLFATAVATINCEGSSQGSGSNGPIVQTTFGKVQGLYTNEARIFLSIPYAGPVDGANRWKDPKFPEPWDGIFNATREGIGCPQNCDFPTPKLTCPSVQVENCLLLNVYTPLSNPSNLPVLVFIHGGDFVQGYGGSSLYDGRYIVDSGGIILVTINYRLGALANIVYETGDDTMIGNFAIKDQRLALEWVKMNIEAFGGNPNDVTIAGQSAGGVSVAIHMTSIKSSGLFHKAIIESYPFAAPIKSMTEARTLGEDFAEALGCGKSNDIDCLYSKSFREVANATSTVNSKIVNVFHLLEVFLQWSPIVDGIEITGQPLTMFSEGKVANVPLMIGTTSQEAVLFVYRAFKKNFNSLDLDELLLVLFPFHFKAVYNLYQSSSDSDDKRPLASIIGTDESFICSTKLAARSVSNYTSFPIYHYVFDHVWSFKEGWKPYSMYEACKNASCHGAELPFIFKTADLNSNFHYTSEELTLTNELQTFVSNFVRNGNPNIGNKEVIEWPSFSAKTGWSTIVLQTPQSKVVSNYRSSYCDVLDSIGYNV